MRFGYDFPTIKQQSRRFVRTAKLSRPEKWERGLFVTIDSRTGDEKMTFVFGQISRGNRFR